MRSIRVSVVQACTAKYSLQNTLEKMDRLVSIAKERDGSQIAVFPEAFIGGYPRHSSFGAVVGDRSSEGREEFLHYYKASVEVPSAAVVQIEQIAQRHNIFLVVGVIERDGGTLYCTVLFIHPSKGYVDKHRKLMPTGSERLIWGCGDGSTLPVVSHSLPPFNASQDDSETAVKISAAICWENYMPLLRTFYYSRGVEIYCAPTVDSRPAWQNTMVHIALEGRCFVLSACQYAQQKDYPENHPHGGVKDLEAVMIGGGSVIVSPLGKVLAGPLWEGEDVLSATLDLDDVIRGKFDLDTVGHYARNDIFQLSVRDQETSVPI